MPLGGKIGKFRYYGYIYRKSRDGYRKYEHTDSEADRYTVAYEPTKNFSVTLEWARSNMFIEYRAL